MAELTVCSAAEEEFSESLCWYAERSEQAAIEFDADVELALQTIATDPQRFPKCDDRHRFYLMRRFPFQIIYQHDGIAPSELDYPIAQVMRWM